MAQTALITGASSGIGRALARVLAREGFGLVLAARDRARLEELAAELASRHPSPVTVVPTDLARPEAPPELHEAVRAAGLTVDLLVNNAGLGLSGRFTAIPLERQEELLQVNVTALTLLCRLFGADMLGTRLERSPLVMDAPAVAEAAVAAVLRGRPLVIPGWINRLAAFAARLAPRRLTAAVAGHLNRR